MKQPTSLSFIAFLAVLSQSLGFQNGRLPRCPGNKMATLTSRSTPSSTTSIHYSNWDAFESLPDSLELLYGGTRYEMSELPDSMVSTTLWVGNLCEFVSDQMLSELFQEASSLIFVPAVVARKPNMESLRYGFVTFRNEEEKEIAINLFHGYEVNGKCLKVEAIKDHEKGGRVRVPMKIIEYAAGPAKRTRNGEVNTMRRATAAATTATGDRMHDSNNEKRGRHANDRELRRARMEKRKTRGRYKNPQRKNSRNTPFL